MEKKKVTTADIRAIKAGETKVFYCPTPRDARSGQSMAHTLSKIEPELGIRFNTSINYEESILTLTAVKRV